MSDMSFLPNLTAFLNTHGTIYTVRHFNYHTRDCYISGVGKCVRTCKRRITAPIELSPYVSESGFTSVPEWWAQIHKFIRPTEDMFLFKVVVKR